MKKLQETLTHRIRTFLSCVNIFQSSLCSPNILPVARDVGLLDRVVEEDDPLDVWRLLKNAAKLWQQLVGGDYSVHLILP